MLDDEGIATLGDLYDKVHTTVRRCGGEGDVSTEDGGGDGGGGSREGGGEGEGEGEGGEGEGEGGGGVGSQVREYLQSLGFSHAHSEAGLCKLHAAAPWFQTLNVNSRFHCLAFKCATCTTATARTSPRRWCAWGKTARA
jgi:hypothetical protein